MLFIFEFVILIVIILLCAMERKSHQYSGGSYLAELADKFKSRTSFTAREDSRLLSMVDSVGIKRPNEFMFTVEGVFSISPPPRAKELVNLIAKRYAGDIRKAAITDATSCVGGDTICFAKNFAEVNAVEINPHNYAALVHNIKLYGFTNITTYYSDYLVVLPKLVQDIVHIDAPWTGLDYKLNETIRLKLGDIYLEDVVGRLIALPKPPHISLKVPKNFDKESMRAAIPAGWVMEVDDVSKFDLIQIMRQQ